MVARMKHRTRSITPRVRTLATFVVGLVLMALGAPALASETPVSVREVDAINARLTRLEDAGERNALLAIGAGLLGGGGGAAVVGSRKPKGASQ